MANNRLILEDLITGYGYEVAVHENSIDKERRVTLPIRDGRLLTEIEIEDLINKHSMSSDDIMDLIGDQGMDKPTDLPFVMHNSYYDKTYEIPSGINAMSQGPIMIGSEGEIKITENSTWGVYGESDEGTVVTELIESIDHNQIVPFLGGDYGGAITGYRNYGNNETYINDSDHSIILYFSVGFDLENGPDDLLTHVKIFVGDNVVLEERDIYKNEYKLGTKIKTYSMLVPGRGTWRIECIGTNIDGSGSYFKGLGITMARKNPNI